jgi:thioredoxin 1
MKQVHTQSEFLEYINSAKLVLVDFFATWCGPCKKLSPILEELSNEIDNFAVIKVDVDSEELEEIVKLHNIESLPTLVFYNNGELEQHSIVGFNSKEEIKKFIMRLK